MKNPRLNWTKHIRNAAVSSRVTIPIYICLCTLFKFSFQTCLRSFWFRWVVDVKRIKAITTIATTTQLTQIYGSAFNLWLHSLSIVPGTHVHGIMNRVTGQPLELKPKTVGAWSECPQNFVYTICQIRICWKQMDSGFDIEVSNCCTPFLMVLCNCSDWVINFVNC